VISPNNRFAYAADLGIDQIVCYRLNSETGELSTAEQAFVRLPPGSGPRHLTFHPKQPWMYVINELLNTVTAFDWNAETGMLIEQSTLSTLPADFKKESWCANMPGNNVQVFRIDAESGNLEPAGGAVEIPMPSCIRILPGKP
jgi:6-phosphogluconolactonase